MIQHNTNVKGIPMKSWEYKQSIFADDLVLFLTPSPESLPKLQIILESFGKISGLRIYQLKSLLYPINLSPSSISILKEQYPHKWVTSKGTDLDLQICLKLKDLLKCTFLHLQWEVGLPKLKWKKFSPTWTNKFIHLYILNSCFSLVPCLYQTQLSFSRNGEE